MAYEVLSDPDKKQIYDRYGEERLKEGGGEGGFETAEDIFASFFGGGFFGGGFGGMSGRGRQRKGEDLIHPLDVTLEDLYNGKTTKLALRKTVICSVCSGKGGKNPDSVRACDTCRGTGVKVTLRQLGPGMVQQLQTVCPKCRGQGEVIREKDRCKRCRGNKVVQEKKVLDIYIDKGMRHKQKIVFAGEGDQEPGVISGDVVIVLNELPHSRFKRNDSHLVITQEINLLQALTGFSLTIPHLDGRTLLVKSNPAQIIRPGDVMEVPGEGMPIHKRPFDKGLLIIKFNVQFPDSLSPEQARGLQALLPQPEPVRLDMENVEEVTLCPYGETEAAQGPASHRTRREAYQEDEGGGASRLDCAQQ